METIVVTGASSGIGRELAIQLSHPDREIWLVARNRDRLEEVAECVRSNGGTPRVVKLDLSDIKGAGRFLAENFPPEKKVDAIYLSAGVTLFGEVRDTLVEDWDRIYHTNLLSPVQWTRHFYEGMVDRQGGKIVIVSSLAAYAGYPTATAYATMKAGLLGLFRSLWHEGQHYNVAVHLASPGYVDTGIYRAAIFRKTCYNKTMHQIRSLGFRVISAEQSATTIIESVNAGCREFAFPAYASVMKWLAPKLPFVMTLVHRRIVNSFRQTS